MTTLSVCQEKASINFEAFLNDPDEKEFVLSGFTGVGKTYMTENFLIALEKRNKFLKEVLQTTGYKLILTATTNKAARVLKKVAEKLKLNIEVTTIHSLLGLTVKRDFKTGTEYLSKTQRTKVHSNVLVFIDEASYADKPLLKIVKECFIHSKIVWIGDRDQLLAVNYNTSPVLHDITCKYTTHMITPQRNQGDINKLAHAYRNVLYGAPWPIIKPSAEIELVDGPTFKSLVDYHFKSQKYLDSDDYVKIIGWTNQKVLDYNNYIRTLYTAKKEYVKGEYLTSNSVIYYGMKPILSADTTLKIEHTSDILVDHNGIQYQRVSFVGLVEVLNVPIDHDALKRQLNYLAKDKNWVDFYKLKDYFADMRPNHACTAHKSQGSTYDYVFIDLDDIASNNKPMEVARLLYVAISRAKHKVYFYGALPEKYGGTDCG